MAKKIEVQIVGDADSFHKALGKASDSTSRFGRVAAGIGKAGFLALGAGAVAAGIGITKAVQAGSDWNETLNKSQVIFGKSSKEVQDWSSTMAEAGGISEQAALDAASTFGTFGKAAGVGKNQLDDWSESLVQAASDLASFHNADPSQVLEDIRSGLAGEVEPLRKYGILLNDAALRQQAMKMGLVDTTKNALSPNNKMLAAQALILKNLGPAAGDFARTSGGLANQQRILKAELENVVTELGQALLPIAVAVAKVAIPALIGAIDFLSGAFKDLIDWVGKITRHFEVFGGKSASTGDRVRNAWKRVQAFFQSEIMPIIKRLRGIFSDAMAAIAKVVQQHGAEIRRIFNRVGTAIKDIANIAMPILRFALTKALPRIIAIAIPAIDKLTAAIEKVKDILKWIGDHSPEQFKKLADAAKRMMPSFVQYLAPGIGQLLLMKDLVQWLIDHVPDIPVIGGNAGGTTGKVPQVPKHGSGGTTNPTFRLGNQAIVVQIDGREIYRAIVNQDKISRRQTGRSLLA